MADQPAPTQERLVSLAEWATDWKKKFGKVKDTDLDSMIGKLVAVTNPPTADETAQAPPRVEVFIVGHGANRLHPHAFEAGKEDANVVTQQILTTLDGQGLLVVKGMVIEWRGAGGRQRKLTVR